VEGDEGDLSAREGGFSLREGEKVTRKKANSKEGGNRQLYNTEKKGGISWTRNLLKVIPA